MYISTVLFVGVLLVALFTYPLLTWIEWSPISGFRDFDLAVGILSSRNHFKQRESIRNTWLNASNLNNTIFRFVVGRDGCDVHPVNRLDQYGCDRKSLAVPVQEETIIPVLSVIEDTPFVPNARIFSDVFSFRVLHSVSVHRLGMLSSMNLENTLTVVLYECSDERAVTSAVFSQTDPGILMGGFRYQPIESVVLPNGFEGFIKLVEDPEITRGYGVQKINLLGGVIQELGMMEHCFREKDFQPKSLVSENQIFVVSMAVSIYEIEKLGLNLEMEQSYDRKWRIQQQTESERLVNEAALHGDILFVDTVDVYRNLPNKLIKFHKWVSRNVNAKFIMKTDDDCYVDMETILRELQKFSLSQVNKKLWWGQFRNNWFVEVDGKWLEPQYTASVYPRFACGSGNIVSQDLSHWLAGNADTLNKYQGEDVSMGIWLAALSPLFVHDERWSCNQSCRADSFVIPELDVDEMELAWENRMRCNNPCTCGDS